MSNPLYNIRLENELRSLERQKKLLEPYKTSSDSTLPGCRTARDSYNFVKLLDGSVDKLGYESAIHTELSRQLPPTNGKWMPLEALTRSDLVAGTNNIGGFLVGQNYTGKELFPFLYNRSVCLNAGATLVLNASSNMALPRMNQNATVAWFGENSTLSDTTSVQFDNVRISTYYRASAITVFSNQLLRQASLDQDVAQIVSADLIASIAVAIDQAALVGAGSGSNQPVGLFNLPVGSGYETVTSVNVGSPFGWVDALEMERVVEAQNIWRNDNSAAYITSPSVKKTLKNRPKTGTQNTNGFIVEYEKDELNGAKFLATNQLTGGSFGNYMVFSPRWSELQIWMAPAISLLPDKYTLASLNQTRIFVDCLVNVVARHSNAFSVSSIAIA